VDPDNPGAPGHGGTSHRRLTAWALMARERTLLDARYGLLTLVTVKVIRDLRGRIGALNKLRDVRVATRV
jgi:hypothetical protein